MVIFDLATIQGSTFGQEVVLHEDITGYTVASSSRDSIGFITSGIATITDIATGTFNIDFTAAQTASMATGVGYYDVELTEASTGKVSKPISGRVYVKGEVTI